MLTLTRQLMMGPLLGIKVGDFACILVYIILSSHQTDLIIFLSPLVRTAVGLQLTVYLTPA